MTVILRGHNFKYEIEAVCKLFFPVRGFSFLCFEGSEQYSDPGGDIIVLTREITGESTRLSVFSWLGESSDSLSESISSEALDFEKACEFILCRLLFMLLRKATGASPEWGMLTGVRPVKLISGLKARGMSDEEICSQLEKNCFVSREKTLLALKTAENQSALISATPKNSVSLYVSIPFCPSRCAYCSFVSQTVAGFYRLMPEYVRRLCEEISLVGEIVRSEGLVLDAVYFGGGTPTSLSAEDLETVMRAVSKSFDLSRLREYTVEAGRPDTVTPEKLRAILDNGGDRISVNPQTLTQSVLDAIGRRHTVEEFFSAYEAAERAGFKRINVDLIAGLPTDSFSGFEKSLRGVLELSPANITVHALSIKRSADLMQGGSETLSAAETSKMIALSNALLSERGYSPYYLYRQKNQLGNQENVGWEIGGTAGVYNVNIMEEIQTVLAVGAGASTKVVSGGKIARFYNPKYPLEYLKKFDETVAARKREAANKISEALLNDDLNGRAENEEK